MTSAREVIAKFCSDWEMSSPAGKQTVSAEEHADWIISALESAGWVP